MSSFDLHNQTYHSNSESSPGDSEDEAYAPCESSTRILRRASSDLENQAPTITLTTPSHNGNPSLVEHSKLQKQRVAEPRKLHSGTWGPGIAKPKAEARARAKEQRSKPVDLPAGCTSPIEHWSEKKATNGETFYHNSATGESTWNRPEGYLDPDERFALGIGIKLRPPAKSATPQKKHRRSSGLWSAARNGDPMRDDLSAGLERLSLENVDEDLRKMGVSAGEQNCIGDGGIDKPARGRSRAAKPQYHARLQAEGIHDSESLDEIREKAKAFWKSDILEENLEKGEVKANCSGTMRKKDAVELPRSSHTAGNAERSAKVQQIADDESIIGTERSN
ncbi:hypothetical protein DOTSEDRAFT_20805 [Dothistroma septosporum NZE10]|uniref:WW domain-containing protein n=1 Tax=Dothistroma septosporum (strain NZE10 / CBS 128990) TaxID=675120 RepID=N1PX42_DOTSN|nr:hypothetical protein DOTSEDRAFT_20805 [Dothistroma septosporum NZE10]